MSITKKRVAILGSTGSIGRQALEVVEENSGFFQIEVLTANNNHVLLIEQAKIFNPNCVVIVNESKYNLVNDALSKLGIQVYCGAKALNEVVSFKDIDIVLTAIVGYAGLESTISAIKSGKNIALANKETLVVAGSLIVDLCEKYGVDIFPVDSEHSAIFQCLAGEEFNPIEKLILTASGGPFFGKRRVDLSSVSVDDALNHPNWNMGAKISVDSATLMNKGLELIEAKWLFDVPVDKIEVVVHPQSIIHSAVQFEDGSIKAQIGLPDMKIPIQYALGFPKRLKNSFRRFSFFDYPGLSFEKPDLDVFPSLKLAYSVAKKGGNSACVMNASNEVFVNAFLNKKINFLKIVDLIEVCLERITFVENPSYADLVMTDKEARKLANTLI